MFCVNLSDAKYCVYNKFLGKEKYEQFLQEQRIDSVVHLEHAKNQFHDFLSKHPIPSSYQTDCDQCSGNYLHQSSNLINCYESRKCFDSINCYGLSDAKDCVDGLGFGEGLTESGLFVDVGINSSSVFQSVECWNNVHNLRYCSHCEDSSNLFGCVGLRGREYSILNKQYSKAEYHKTIEEITRLMKAKRKWGKPLAPSFSGFAYNHSLAGDIFPLSQAQATLMGHYWDERGEGIKPSQLLSLGDANTPVIFEDIPDSLTDASLDQVFNAIYLCEMTGRPFRVVKQEALLLQSMKIALPTRCFEQRHAERLKKLSVGKLESREDIEGDQIESSFSKSWKRDVLSLSKFKKVVEENSENIQAS